jgi:hypothetical protein
VICGWKIDAKNFRAVPFGADGKPLPELDLYPLAQAIRDLAVNAARDDMDDMEGDLTKMVHRQGW